MGLTNGNITITCPEEAPLRFREGVRIQFLLSRAREQFGPGGITDGEGFEVSEEIDLDAGSYSFRKAAAAGKAYVSKQEVQRWMADVVAEEIQQPSITLESTLAQKGARTHPRTAGLCRLQHKGGTGPESPQRCSPQELGAGWPPGQAAGGHPQGWLACPAQRTASQARPRAV